MRGCPHRIRLAALVLLAALSARHAPGQPPQGFLQYRWGTPFERMEHALHLEAVQTTGPVRQYASDIASLGTARLEACDLEFTRGRFTGVFLTTRGRKNSHELLRVLQGLFGEGETDDTLGFLWMRGDTHVAYDEDSAGDATVYWYSISMQEGQEHIP